MNIIFSAYSLATALVTAAALLAACVVQFRVGERGAINFRRLIVVLASFRLFYAALGTYLQYYVWSVNQFTQLLLPPTAPWNYFIKYSFTHYWLNALLSIFAAGFLWMFFEILRRRNLGVIKKEESLAALLCALIVGWPAPLVLIPVAFVFSAFFVLIFAGLRFGTRFADILNKPTFEWPLLLATPVAILFAKSILLYLGLGAIFA